MVAVPTTEVVPRGGNKISAYQATRRCTCPVLILNNNNKKEKYNKIFR